MIRIFRLMKKSGFMKAEQINDMVVPSAQLKNATRGGAAFVKTFQG